MFVLSNRNEDTNMSLRKNTAPPAPVPPALTLEDVAEQVRKSLVHKAPAAFRCTHCYTLSDSDHVDKLCRSCSTHGERPNLLQFTARKMGYSTGSPSDLLEVLGATLSEAEIWEATPEELARHWDVNSVEVYPASVSSKMVVVNNQFATGVEFGDFQETPPRYRPLLQSEKDALRSAELEANKSETAKRANAQLISAEAAVEKAKTNLDRARQNFEASL